MSAPSCRRAPLRDVTTLQRTERKKRKVSFFQKPEELVQIQEYSSKQPPKKVVDLDNVFSIAQNSSITFRIKVPKRKLAVYQSENEEVITWDESEDYGSLYSLADFGDKVQVKVTRDTEKMSVAELRDELKQRGLITQGTKQALRERLDDAIKRELQMMESNK
jgi:hypothetical protein